MSIDDFEHTYKEEKVNGSECLCVLRGRSRSIGGFIELHSLSRIH